MGWDSAKRYKPRPVGFSGTHVEKPPALPEPDLEETDVAPAVSEEGRATIDRYSRALILMAREDRRFELNRKIFHRWDEHTQLWWINQIEQQARDGKDTIGAQVVARVVMERLD